ncbi:MAG: stage 0 sporulation family protein [Candidatus Zixiibacteriota bacterium]
MAELYLVEFKGSRKEYFFNTYYHSLKPREYVVIQADRGEDIGLLAKKINTDIALTGSSRPRSILRRASDEDVAELRELREKEAAFKRDVNESIENHGLPMKVVDIECQFDGNKMTVYFTADHRVDFRELVKDLAGQYRTRIELRQIGVRDEAKRIGGYGICGKEQCCSSFIGEFSPVSTQMARDQDLPLNPSKISGNCGRLLCCLRYEVDTYVKVRKTFPALGSRVKALAGEGFLHRIDVFNEEAVVRLDDGVLVRATAANLTLVSKERAAPTKKSAADDASDTSEDTDREELRKLDETET